MFFLGNVPRFGTHHFILLCWGLDEADEDSSSADPVSKSRIFPLHCLGLDPISLLGRIEGSLAALLRTCSAGGPE